MLNEIQKKLQERFAAPKPEFHRRRVVFWRDEEREFENGLDSLELPGVKVVKLEDDNNFSVKKLLLHDDVESDFLIYAPLQVANGQANWLRDVELWSEEFRADAVSMQTSRLQIEKSAESAVRSAVKRFDKFFANKERVDRLRKIGRVYQNEARFELDVLSVLVGCDGGAAQDLVVAVLSDGLDEEKNAAFNEIRKFGDVDVFWKFARQCVGAVAEENTLLNLATRLFFTAFLQTASVDVLNGLERFFESPEQNKDEPRVSKRLREESLRAFCYDVVDRWRDDLKRNETLFELCRAVESEWNLSKRFDEQELETLLGADVFPGVDESILRRFFDDAADDALKLDLVFQTLERRRTIGWRERYAHYYDALRYLAETRRFYCENDGGFHFGKAKEIWDFYTRKASETDRRYRRFHLACDAAQKNGASRLEDSVKRAAEKIDALYRNWFLAELTESWTNAIADDVATRGEVADVPRQRDFYSKYVEPLRKKNTRVFVVVSDALRYEVATELCDELDKTTKGTTSLEAVQATFPTITKLGMASLLPGRKLSLDARLDVLVDGLPTRSTKEREKVLCVKNPRSVAVSFDDVLNRKRDERRALVKDQDVVYIYHNAIDAIGDAAPTEKNVFEACETAKAELVRLLKIIVADMQGTNVFVTADHGFLYERAPLTSSDKIDGALFSEEPLELGRRYALTTPTTRAVGLLETRLSESFDAVAFKAFTPRNVARIKKAGGGENYTHGGVSLQEMVVPVVHFKNLRSASKKYEEISNVELTLLSETRKISNLQFRLDFFQPQAVGPKTRVCEYVLYVKDEAGGAVSDKRVVIADKTNADPRERVTTVRFNLKPGAYDKNKKYRLVIENGFDPPQEVEFCIDVVFADDFGF